MTPITAVSGGVRIRIHVQPRASTTEVSGLHGGAIKIRLQAAPVDGGANEALIRFLADRLDVARGAVTLESGHTGRAKLVRVEGVTVEVAARRLGPL